jgi:hypothetical protein
MKCKSTTLMFVVKGFERNNPLLCNDQGSQRWSNCAGPETEPQDDG